MFMPGAKPKALCASITQGKCNYSRNALAGRHQTDQIRPASNCVACIVKDNIAEAGCRFGRVDSMESCASRSPQNDQMIFFDVKGSSTARRDISVETD